MLLSQYLANVAKRQPLIHNITNYVTVNDVANALLALGASPIMADEPQDAPDITAICDALCINIGTLNAQTIVAMKTSAARSCELRHPIILDPVGAGASALRTQTSVMLMKTYSPCVIRGNISEILALFAGESATRGVDANAADAVSEINLSKVAKMLCSFAGSANAVIAVTGEIDLVANSERCFAIYNGCAMMAKITGSGCMLSALVAAFVAANDSNANTAMAYDNIVLESVAAAIAFMGITGEHALKVVSGSPQLGTASFRVALIDAISQITTNTLDTESKLREL